MIFRFAHSWYLLLLLAVPYLIFYYYFRRRRISGAVRFSDIHILKRIRASSMQKIRENLFLLRIAAIVLLILAMARPQSGLKSEELLTEGIDIMLTVDVSGSMKSPDFKPKNRLHVAKEKVAEFIKNRKNDRIGMVVFAGRAYTQCPLTLDYGVLLSFLKEVDIGMIEDGTAIGMAIATSVNRLKDSKSKNRIIVLLTDGANNAGSVDPITAARAAKALGIKIYTIGVGREVAVPQLVKDPIFGRRYIPRGAQELDLDTLKDIAKETDGNFFLATDPKALEKAYKIINELETTEIKVKEYTRYFELFPYFAGMAFFLVILEVVLLNTRFRKIP